MSLLFELLILCTLMSVIISSIGILIYNIDRKLYIKDEQRLSENIPEKPLEDDNHKPSKYISEAKNDNPVNGKEYSKLPDENQSEKLPEIQPNPSEIIVPCTTVENINDQPIIRPKIVIQNMEVIKNIRKVMIDNLGNFDDLSASDLSLIEKYKEDPDTIDSVIEENSADDWSTLGDSVKLNMRILKQSVADKNDEREVYIKFVADFLEAICDDIALKIDQKSFEMFKEVSATIDLLELFLMYEYISLCDESGHLRDQNSSVHDTLVRITSKIRKFDEHFKRHMMYYFTANLLSNYLFEFGKYRSKIETVTSWKEQLEKSDIECQKENYDAFEFFCKSYKALKIK